MIKVDKIILNLFASHRSYKKPGVRLTVMNYFDPKPSPTSDQPNFKIEKKGPASESFLERNISDFRQAMLFVKNLPYGRNQNKEILTTVFSDNCGTCSTKHALLKLLADENGFKDLVLVIGIFKMGAANTPLVKNTLKNYQLEFLPEAHNYLRYKGAIIDCTKINWGASAFEGDILEEIEILPNQITAYKVDYHKKFIRKWLMKNKHVPYDPEQLWAIKEQCIADLSNGT